jgi:hypothetical protein
MFLFLHIGDTNEKNTFLPTSFSGICRSEYMYRSGVKTLQGIIGYQKR